MFSGRRLFGVLPMTRIKGPIVHRAPRCSDHIRAAASMSFRQV